MDDVFNKFNNFFVNVGTKLADEIEDPVTSNDNLIQWFPTGVTDPFSMGRQTLGKKKVQKNDHALILRGSECMLFTLLNSRWRRYPVIIIDSCHFTDRRKATVCFHMRVTMAKCRYDIDYIK